MPGIPLNMFWTCESMREQCAASRENTRAWRRGAWDAHTMRGVGGGAFGTRSKEGGGNGGNFGLCGCGCGCGGRGSDSPSAGKAGNGSDCTARCSSMWVEHAQWEYLHAQPQPEVIRAVVIHRSPLFGPARAMGCGDMAPAWSGMWMRIHLRDMFLIASPCTATHGWVPVPNSTRQIPRAQTSAA